MAFDPKWRIREWFTDLDERALERLRIYHLELVRWNTKINLISSGTSEFADRVHFADSILGVRLILPEIKKQKEVWDLGSGNGFPGIILGILRPDLFILCADSDERKIGFLKNMALRLELPNISARKTRIEEIPPNSISCAVTRGLGTVERIIALVNNQVGVGGIVYHFKGTDWEKEVEAVPKAVRSTWNTESLGHYRLPNGEELSKIQRPEARIILKSIKLK
jgi:16S rRNA (guanine527-N7)-methyltransferase